MSKRIKKQKREKRGFWSSLFNTDSYYSPRRPWYSLYEEKKEIVAPFMGGYDQRILADKIHHKLVNNANSKLIREFENGGDYQRTIKEAIPSHLIADIYNLYYHKTSVHNYSIIDDTNRGKWKLLQAVNDSGIKIMTNGNSLNSSIFTLEICKALMENLNREKMRKMAAYMKNVETEHSEDGEENEDQPDGSSGGGDKEGEDNKDSQRNNKQQNSNSAEGEGGESNGKNSSQKKRADNNDESKKGNKQENQQSTNGEKQDKRKDKKNKESENPPNRRNTEFENLVSKMIDSSEFLKDLQTAKGNAFKRIEEYEKLGIGASKLTISQHDLDFADDLDSVKNQLSQIRMNEKGIKSVCEKIIDTSMSHFSRKSKLTEISVFESDIFDEFEGLEFLNPAFRGTKLEEVVTREELYYGRVNIYVDVSGSMDSGIKISGCDTSHMMFAKALILKMMGMGLVNKVIPFGNNIKTVINDPTLLDVMKLMPHCGTNLDRVVQHADENRQNSLIITDGCDNISIHSPNVFFLGTPGAFFRLRTEESKKLLLHDQLWVFDGAGEDVNPYKG